MCDQPSSNNDVAPGLMARVDIELMIEFFFNLIDNSVKFSKARGLVELKARQDESGIVVTVGDNGIGIPQKFMANLFASWDSTTRLGSAYEKRSGYGLIMCKEIIEAHAGTIEAESVEGEWTTFKIRIPSAPAAVISSGH